MSSVILAGTAGWGSGTRGRPGPHGSWPGLLLAAGHRAVRPPPHGTAEALSAALPVFQWPTADQSALPVTYRRLLQQPSEQDHSGARDELCSAGHVYSGTFCTYAKFSDSVWKLMRLKNKNEPAVYPCHPHYPKTSPIYVLDCHDSKTGVWVLYIFLFGGFQEKGIFPVKPVLRKCF